MIAKQDADQEQIQKANNAVDLLKAGIIEAMDRGLFGEVTVTVKVQNGRIGHFERLVRETYK
jgi:uncharacterized protein with FMN-binding domain